MINADWHFIMMQEVRGKYLQVDMGDQRRLAFHCDAGEIVDDERTLRRVINADWHSIVMQGRFLERLTSHASPPTLQAPATIEPSILKNLLKSVGL